LTGFVEFLFFLIGLDLTQIPSFHLAIALAYFYSHIPHVNTLFLSSDTFCFWFAGHGHFHFRASLTFFLALGGLLWPISAIQQRFEG
jgi:hypothetical protein